MHVRDDATAVAATEVMPAPSQGDRAAVRAVPAAVRREDSDADPPVGRAAFRGAVIGFILVTAGMTVIGLIGAAGLGGAIGMGVFVGVWGGVGFGAMLGATSCIARADDARIAVEKERRRQQVPAGVDLSSVKSDRATD